MSGPYYDPQQAGLSEHARVRDDASRLGAQSSVHPRFTGRGQRKPRNSDRIVAYLAGLPHLRWRRLPVLPLSKSRAMLERRYLQAWAGGRASGSSNSTAGTPRPPPTVIVDELSAARHVLEEAALDVLVFTDLGLHAP